MLRELHIENIAIIEKADIEFNGGFNVMTGETGAGKSIVIDSLDAVLGGRTSRDLVRRGADRATVTAVFDGDAGDAWLRENDLEPEDELMLQGVVDCCWETEEGVTVLDFKTDRISREELPRRAQQYRPQVDAYAMALSQILGKPVNRKLLYFFHLNCSWEFPPEG